MIAALLRREPATQVIHDYLWFVNQRYRVGTSVVFGRVAKLQSRRTGGTRELAQFDHKDRLTAVGRMNTTEQAVVRWDKG